MSIEAQTELQIMRHSNPHYAMGLACEILRSQPPYSDFKFGPFCGSLLGQIQREHYFFTTQGKKILGYAGWALTTEAVAEKVLNENYSPTNEECINGECWLGLTFYAATKEVCLFQSRQLRLRYPNVKVYFRRIYPDKPTHAMRTFNYIPQDES